MGEPGVNRAPSTTRVLGPHEHRAALNLFRDSHHQPPVTDTDWPVLRKTLEPGSVRAEFLDGQLLGMQQTISGDLIVPGGTKVPAAICARLAVRTGHTRRGVGTRLMKAALRATQAPLMTVRVSEGGIYGRFGFAVGTRARDLVIDRHRARLESHVPECGHTFVSCSEGRAELIPLLHEELRGRAGTVRRPDWYESLYSHDMAASGLLSKVIVHKGPDGADGFARYTVDRVVTRDAGARLILQVDDMHYSSPEAWTGLWRTLLNVELVDEIRVQLRPLDEPVEWLFTDPRVCRTRAVQDETWLRLTDVGAALRARRFEGDGSVVIGVDDALLPANSGCYRVSGDGAGRTRAAARITGSVAAWSAAYLGTVRPSALAATGALRVDDAQSLRTADELFSVRSEPWSGSFF
ncbi:GNAT family N-acetyltransferase [Streptomyces uncialis]|uniref:GNAT family N-acetyltransferase n=1 Tax=Streptomyces uncialis TaxID=1048205 RepID=UPI00386ECDC6|nr:GNAT family N-acetyltransferase [Streptomyces uncialis]